MIRTAQDSQVLGKLSLPETVLFILVVIYFVRLLVGQLVCLWIVCCTETSAALCGRLEQLKKRCTGGQQRSNRAVVTTALVCEQPSWVASRLPYSLAVCFLSAHCLFSFFIHSYLYAFFFLCLHRLQEYLGNIGYMVTRDEIR